MTAMRSCLDQRVANPVELHPDSQRWWSADAAATTCYFSIVYGEEIQAS